MGVSGSTVRRRLTALEDRGIVRGYTAVVDPGALGEPTTALFSIKPRSDAPAKQSIAETLRRRQEITASYTMSGDRPHIAVGRFPSPEAAESVANRLGDELSARVNVDFVLKTRFGHVTWSPDPGLGPTLRDTDRIIIDVLTVDGRASLDTLGKKANLSKSTVHKRLQTLENRGVIRGYTTLLDSEALGLPVTAVFGVNPNTGCPTDSSNFDQLQGFPEIWTCYTLSGRRPAVAVGTYSDIAAARTTADRLGEHLSATVSVDFVLATDFDRYHLPRHGQGRPQWSHDAAPGQPQPVR